MKKEIEKSKYHMIARRRVLQSKETSHTICTFCGKRGTHHYYRARSFKLRDGWYCLVCVKNAYGYANHIKNGYPPKLWRMPELILLPIAEVIKSAKLDKNGLPTVEC